MRDVAVMKVAGLHVQILEPLLKLPCLADLTGRKPRPGLGNFARSSSSLPRTSAAVIVWANRSRMISMSIVGPAQTEPPRG